MPAEALGRSFLCILYRNQYNKVLIKTARTKCLLCLKVTTQEMTEVKQEVYQVKNADILTDSTGTSTYTVSMSVRIVAKSDY